MCFSHVPHWFIKVFLHDVHKFYKIQLILKEENGYIVCLPANDVFVNKPFVTFVLWALEALFVAEKSIVVNENDRKIIEEDSSFHLTYQTLISDD